MNKRILVADDHEFMRRGVVAELSHLFPCAEILEAGNGDQVLQHLEQHSAIDLAIVDLSMPGNSGKDLVKQVCQRFPQLPVVVMTASQALTDMQACVEAGVSGYLPKTLGKDEVNIALKQVIDGDCYFPDVEQFEVTQGVDRPKSEVDTPTRATLESLTGRQRQVLQHLLSGDANKIIARKLDCSDNTVKVHVTAILRAFGYSKRTQLIAELHEYASSLRVM
jgi:DNA-binding NarL/FixJ family response regulator